MGLTSDRVYRWRLILEEYGPEIVYIKGIHNTIADAISRLDISLTPPTTKVEERQNWMTFTKCWCEVTNSHNDSTSTHEESMTHVFANCSDEGEIYPLTVTEIAEACDEF